MALDTAPRLVAVGDFMFDIIARLSGPIRNGTDTRAVIDRKPGGSASNMAAWLATTGTKATLAVAVGEADLDEITSLLHSHCLQPRLHAISAISTGTLVSLVDSGGERSFLSDRGANDLLDVTPWIENLLQDTDFLYVSGYTATTLISRRSVAELLAAARESDIPICIDVGSAAFAEELGATEFLQWVSPCDILVANNDEACVLAGSADPEKQFETLSKVAQTVIIKSGPNGSAALDRSVGQVLSYPPANIKIIDTTGAGDAFLAGFLAARFQGHDLYEQLASATRFAALSLVTVGGFPNRT